VTERPKTQAQFSVGKLAVGRDQPLALIAGPCVLEDEPLVLSIAERLATLAEDLKLNLIFKASYEKDNRSRKDGYRGPGLKDGLALLAKIKERFNLPIISDVHRESDVAAAADVLDIVQVPAFLCQQTSLLEEVGRRARACNIKKGQFIAPEDMAGSVEKVSAAGCQNVMLTERGSCFGYNRLVADMTSIVTLHDLGCPVVFDATHIVRRYGISSSDPAGGAPRFIPTLAKSGVAAGCDLLFIETHPDPPRARCDAASVFALDELEGLLRQVLPIADIVRRPSSRSER